MCEKVSIWNSATCSCENGNCAGSITYGLVILCDRVLDATKTILTKTVPARSNS